MTRILTTRMMTGTMRNINISVIQDQMENSEAESLAVADGRTIQLWSVESYVHRYSCMEPTSRQPITIQTDTFSARPAVQ